MPSNGSRHNDEALGSAGDEQVATSPRPDAAWTYRISRIWQTLSKLT